MFEQPFYIAGSFVHIIRGEKCTVPSRETDSFACRYGVLQGQVPVQAMLLLVAGAMVITLLDHLYI